MSLELYGFPYLAWEKNLDLAVASWKAPLCQYVIDDVTNVMKRVNSYLSYNLVNWNHGDYEIRGDISAWPIGFVDAGDVMLIQDIMNNNARINGLRLILNQMVVRSGFILDSSLLDDMIHHARNTFQHMQVNDMRRYATGIYVYGDIPISRSCTLDIDGVEFKQKVINPNKVTAGVTSWKYRNILLWETVNMNLSGTTNFLQNVRTSTLLYETCLENWGTNYELEVENLKQELYHNFNVVLGDSQSMRQVYNRIIELIILGVTYEMVMPEIQEWIREATTVIEQIGDRQKFLIPDDYIEGEYDLHINELEGGSRKFKPLILGGSRNIFGMPLVPINQNLITYGDLIDLLDHNVTPNWNKEIASVNWKGQLSVQGNGKEVTWHPLNYENAAIWGKRQIAMYNKRLDQFAFIFKNENYNTGWIPYPWYLLIGDKPMYNERGRLMNGEG